MFHCFLSVKSFPCGSSLILISMPGAYAYFLLAFFYSELTLIKSVRFSFGSLLYSTFVRWCFINLACHNSHEWWDSTASNLLKLLQSFNGSLEGRYLLVNSWKLLHVPFWEAVLCAGCAMWPYLLGHYLEVVICITLTAFGGPRWNASSWSISAIILLWVQEVVIFLLKLSADSDV